MIGSKYTGHSFYGITADTLLSIYPLLEIEAAWLDVKILKSNNSGFFPLDCLLSASLKQPNHVHPCFSKINICYLNKIYNIQYLN